MIIKEIRKDGTFYIIAICKNKNDKYQYVNITKNKICECEFESETAAFSDLLKYIKDGKIKELKFIQ